MIIERNDVETLVAELHIRLEPIDYSVRVEKAIQAYRKRAQIPGFRPGHIPVSLVKQRYGKGILTEEVQHVLQENLRNYINDNNLQVLGSPLPTASNIDSIAWDNPGEFTFVYEIGLAPTIEVELNKEMSFPYFRVIVTDDMIDRQLKDLARRYGKMSDQEVSGDEDMLMVDLAEQDINGGIKLDGIHSQTTVSIEYIKDAATKAQLTGLKIGEIASINPHLLNDNHDDLAKMLGVEHAQLHALESMFELKVNEIKRIEPHAFDQELFDKLFGKDELTTVDEMRARTKFDMEKMFERDADFLFKKEFSRKITAAQNFELPDSFLKKFIVMSNEKPVTIDMVEAEYPTYSAQLRWQLIESKIIQQYGLQVTPQEATAHVKEVLAARYAQYGIPLEEAQLDEFARKTLSNKDEVKNVFDFLYNEKMIALVKERCTLEEIMISYDDFLHKVQH